MNFTLRVWRQSDNSSSGTFAEHTVKDITPDISFLEMLDLLNNDLISRGEEPVAFDSDCREGICGTCCIVINGRPHGHEHGGTVCQLYMRSFRDGDVITMEPLRVRSFPIVRDLVVDRSVLDSIIAAGGYVSVKTGAAPDANAIPILKEDAEEAMDAAQCVGCGACAAICKNAAAMLFVSAKLGHLSRLPQGRVEWKRRVLGMVAAMDKAGFGNCTNEGECEATCPKEIKMGNIARMNLQFLRAALTKR
jgi:succinate dehydrogenase / fumarate reductase iron-sulfur subunit